MRPDTPHKSFNWKNRKILIVEDDYVNYLYYHEILACAGACLFRAVSLQEAFDMIDSAVHFDLLIINTEIPGNEDCRSIRRMKMLWPGLHIIAIAGCKCKRKGGYCHPSGCDTMISHDIDGQEMLAAVDELIAG